jgi:hypothetical protein
VWVNLDYNIEFANYIIKPTIIHPGMCHLIYTIVYDVIIYSIINSYTIIVYDVIINSIINSYTIVYNVISHTYTHTYIYYNNSYLDTYSVLTTCNWQVLFFVQKCSIISDKQVWQPHFEYFRTLRVVIIYIIYNSCLGIICTYYGFLFCLANNSISRTMLIILNAFTCFMFCVCVCVFLLKNFIKHHAFLAIMFHVFKFLFPLNTMHLSPSCFVFFFFLPFEHHAFVIFMLHDFYFFIFLFLPLNAMHL